MTMLLKYRRLKGESRMGITTVRARLSNVKDESRTAEVDMTVDSGAIYSVVPGAVLASIGVEAERIDSFALADGQSVRRRVGHVRFDIEDSDGISKVIFGEGDDACLLGMVTLETLGLALDPLKRRLRPLRLMIA
jgi:predicted aspartyl protease